MADFLIENEEMLNTLVGFEKMMNSQRGIENDLELLTYLCKNRVPLQINVVGRRCCMICASEIKDEQVVNLDCDCHQNVHYSCLNKSFRNLKCISCKKKTRMENLIGDLHEDENNTEQESTIKCKKKKNFGKEEFKSNLLMYKTSLMSGSSNLDNNYNIDDNNEFKPDLFLDEKCLEQAKEIRNYKDIKSIQLQKDVNELCQSFKENKLLLILIGETSAGKTTLINRILSYSLKNNSFKKDFYNLLPSKAEENTAYLWVIEKSKDTNIWVEITGKPKTKYLVSEAEKLKKDLKELDVQQLELIKQMKSKDSDEFLKQRVTVTIQLPWLDPKLKIVDFPGLSSQTVLNELQRLITHSIAYFLYVKDLCAPEILKENFIELVERFSKNNKNHELEPKIFSLVFTKKDQFFSVSNSEVAEYNGIENMIYDQKLERFMNILDQTERFLADKGLKIKRVDFFNLLFLNKDEKELNFFRNFIIQLHATKNMILYQKRPFIFLSSLVEIADSHFQKKLHDSKALFDVETSRKIEGLRKKLLEEYKIKLEKFFKHIRNPTLCQKKEKEFYEKIKCLLENTIAKESKREFKWNRKNFIESVSSLCGQDVMFNFFQKLQFLFNPIFEEFLNEVLIYIGEVRFEDILNINPKKFAIKIDENLTQIGLKLDFSLLIDSVTTIAKEKYLTVMGGAGAIAGEAMLPGVGWIVAVFTMGSFLWENKESLGVFSTKNCLDDIMKGILKFLNDNEQRITEYVTKEASNLFENVNEKINSYRELPNEFLKCKRIILGHRDSLKVERREDEKEVENNDIWGKIQVQELIFDEKMEKFAPFLMNQRMGQ